MYWELHRKSALASKMRRQALVIQNAGIKAAGVGTPEQMQGADLILLGTKELTREKRERLVEV